MENKIMMQGCRANNQDVTYILPNSRGLGMLRARAKKVAHSVDRLYTQSRSGASTPRKLSIETYTPGQSNTPSMKRSKSAELLRPKSQDALQTSQGIGKGRADLREFEYKVPVNANVQYQKTKERISSNPILKEDISALKNF